jgi:molecular chaperone GrpE (heat shock protein)
MNPRIGRLKADENTLKGLTMLLNDMCESFDKTARMKNASENDMARSLLPVLDSAAMMEEQLSSLKSQEAAKELLISLSDIKKAFETEGFSEMDVKGKKFDPNYHHAIAYVDSKSGLPKDTVDRVAKNGYYFNGEIIRFAEVYLSDRKRVVEATAKVAV